MIESNYYKRAVYFFLAAVILFIPNLSAYAQATPQAPGIFPHALLYVTSSKAAIKSLRMHIDSMDIIAPQTYAAKEDGTLLGVPNVQILDLAHNAGAQMMPLVINQNFSQSAVHNFLQNPAAQDLLVSALIAEAKKQGYMGFQYDFEHMMASDKEAYSAFVARSAPLFHAANLQFSVAVAPRHSDDPAEYGDGSWDNWTGAFDYHAIGAVADFVSVMAYDDSKSVGPVASLPWVQSVLDYSLDRIPAEKISLGVPFYTWIWRVKTGEMDHIRGYPAVAELLKTKSYIKKGWSDELGVSFVTYFKGNKKFTAWYEDQKSFQRKLSLITDNKLYGFSAWALGLEDPKVWDTMLAMRAPRYGLALNR